MLTFCLLSIKFTCNIQTPLPRLELPQCIYAQPTQLSAHAFCTMLIFTASIDVFISI